MRTVKGATADVTDQLNGELYEPCQTNNHARLNYHVAEMGLWPVQVCAEALPLPLRHINSGGEKDKPSTTNAQQCRVQPTHSDTVTQTADRVSTKRQQPGGSPSLDSDRMLLYLCRLQRERR